MVVISLDKVIGPLTVRLGRTTPVARLNDPEEDVTAPVPIALAF